MRQNPIVSMKTYCAWEKKTGSKTKYTNVLILRIVKMFLNTPTLSKVQKQRKYAVGNRSRILPPFPGHHSLHLPWLRSLAGTVTCNSLHEPHRHRQAGGEWPLL